MSQVTEQTESSRAETVMRVTLAQNPNALVAAVDRDGLLVDMPHTVPLTNHRIAIARSALDLVQPAHRYAVITAWERAKTEGASRATVVLAGEANTTATMYLFDVTPEHGVFIGITVASDSTVVTLDEAPAIDPTPTRLTRTRKDAMAVIIGAEPTVTAVLGWDVSEIVGQRSLDLIHPDDHERAINMWMECLSQPGYTCRSRLRHAHRDGRWIWLEFSNHNRLDDADAGYVDCEMFDISEEMEAHEAVRASEQLLRSLAGALPVGVVQFDLDRRIVYANERLYEIVGAHRDADEDTLLTCVVDTSVVEDALARMYAGSDVDIEMYIDRLDGTGRRRCTLAMRALINGDGAVCGGVACLADITDAARMRAELEERANFDALTGCLNRSSVMSALSAMLADLGDEPAADQAGGIAVVFVDFDRFKSVNDRFGHAVGDSLLVGVASRLGGVVRTGDIVGRLGGDEFLIVCPDVVDSEEALSLGERITAAITSPLMIGAVRLAPTASVGVVWAAARRGIETGALIAEADAAMYSAKRAGHGRPVVAVSQLGTLSPGRVVDDRRDVVGRQRSGEQVALRLIATELA
jgi:diguanylate cyclase (GGDEF)-like protein/PAS domain S-box-containing protein